jgi:carbon monoxide dehydrogenase subunit G
MKMSGERLLPVPPREAWDALNDPAMLKACIPGCESVTMTEPQRYELVMAAKIGPVSARFKGRLTQTDVVEPQSYSIHFDGQGGAAGFGKGTAEVRLAQAEGGTRLDYDVSAQIGGKLAQIGSRLVDAAARKISDEFFGNFESRLRERVAASTPGTPLASGEPGPASPATPPAEPAIAVAAPSGPDEAQRIAVAAEADRRDHRTRWLMWAIALAAAAALMIWLGR